MSRIRACLKSLPTFALVVLVAAWVGSWFGSVTQAVRHPRGGVVVRFIARGSVGITWTALMRPRPLSVNFRSDPLRSADCFGYFAVHHDSQTVLPEHTEIALPLLWLIVAILPLAVGARTRFRFSLRMWLVWFALLAAVCALTEYRAFHWR